MRLSGSIVCLLLLPLINGQSLSELPPAVTSPAVPPVESPGAPPVTPPIDSDTTIPTGPTTTITDPMTPITTEPTITTDPTSTPTPVPQVPEVLIDCPATSANTVIINTGRSSSDTSPSPSPGSACCNYNSLGQNVCIEFQVIGTSPTPGEPTPGTPSPGVSSPGVPSPGTPSPVTPISTARTTTTPITSVTPQVIIQDGYSVIPATTEAIVQTIGGVTLTSVSGGTPTTLTRDYGRLITSTTGGVTSISVSGGRLMTSLVTRPARTLARVSGTAGSTGGGERSLMVGDDGWRLMLVLTVIPFIVGFAWL